MERLDRYLRKPGLERQLNILLLIFGGLIIFVLLVVAVSMTIDAERAVVDKNADISRVLEPIAIPLVSYELTSAPAIAPKPRFISEKEISTEDYLKEPDPYILDEEVRDPCFISDEEGYNHGYLEQGLCTRCGAFIPKYGFTEDEVYLLTQLLCGSAKISGDGEYDFDYHIQHGKPVNAYQIALVLNVVMNRVMLPGCYANNVTDVVMQKSQFSVMTKNATKTPDPGAVDYIREWCKMYDSWDPEAQVIPENHLYFCAGPNNTNISRASYRR